MYSTKVNHIDALVIEHIAWRMITPTPLYRKRDLVVRQKVLTFNAHVIDCNSLSFPLIEIHHSMIHRVYAPTLRLWP
jgi:hypothetical protein